MKPSILDATAPLVGRTLFGFRLAGGMLCLQLGPRRLTRNRAGRPIEVGELALHVSCTWRFVGPRGLITGIDDTNEDPLPDLGHDGRTLAHQRLRPLFADDAPLRVLDRSADDFGGLVLELTDGLRLDVVPVGTAPDTEHWRLFGAEDAPHFVVTASGIER